MLFTRIAVLFVSKAVVLRDNSKSKDGEKERRKASLSAFSRVDTFPIPTRRDDGQSQTKVTCCERKPYLSPFLVDWRIILKDKNELKVFRESRSHFMVR